MEQDPKKHRSQCEINVTVNISIKNGLIIFKNLLDFLFDIGRMIQLKHLAQSSHLETIRIMDIRFSLEIRNQYLIIRECQVIILH